MNAPHPKLRTRRCKVKTCRAKFEPAAPFQVWCSPECGTTLAMQKLERKKALDLVRRKRAAAKERQEHKKKLEAVKPLSWFINRTRTACHDYIKARDFGRPCICCGEAIDWYGDPMQIHAGHWRTQGAAGHLRFNEDNIHAQRAACNLYGAGNQSAMEQGMVERIGKDRVEALRLDNRVHNWTREELTKLWNYFRQKTKELRKQREGDCSQKSYDPSREMAYELNNPNLKPNPEDKL